MHVAKRAVLQGATSRSRLLDNRIADRGPPSLSPPGRRARVESRWGRFTCQWESTVGARHSACRGGSWQCLSSLAPRASKGEHADSGASFVDDDESTKLERRLELMEGTDDHVSRFLRHHVLRTKLDDARPDVLGQREKRPESRGRE